MQHEQGYVLGKSGSHRMDHVCLLRGDVMDSNYPSRTKRLRVRTHGIEEPNPHLFRGPC
jgi:hypothetical protein